MKTSREDKEKKLMEQRNIPMAPQIYPEAKEVPEWMLEGIEYIEDAARVCMRESIVKRTDESWADLLGVKSAANFSEYMTPPPKKTRKANGRRYFRGEWINELEMLAGNMAITQWLALGKKRRLSAVPENEQKIQDLQRQIDDLRRSA